MKAIAKFSLRSLAFLCVLMTADISPARAQQAKSSTAAPAAADAATQTDAPLAARPVADKLARAGWTRYEFGDPARFSLILPAEPMVKVGRVTIIPGVAATTRDYLSVTESGVYGVS